MSSLSNLANSLTEGIHKIKCEDCNCFLEYESFKNNLIKYECLSWNKNYSNKIDKVLKKRFWNTFKFSNNDSNKSILLLRKGVWYIEEWKKFNELSFPKKKDFYNKINMEDIPDANYTHAKRAKINNKELKFRRWKIKNKKFRWLSRFVSQKRYITIGRCFEKL